MTKKQDIFTALISLLSTIAGVQKVTKRIYSFEDISSFPIISIISTGTQKEISGNSALYKVEASFGIIGFVKASYDTGDSGTLTDTLESLAESIEEKILADETIYDLGVTKIEIENEEIAPDYEANIGFVQIGLKVSYFTDTNI